MTKRLERKISVDVSDMTHEQKKRVQDCFFKLGYEWEFNGRGYQRLDAIEYSNTYDGSNLNDNLLYGVCGIFSVPPISLEELERITAEFTGESDMQEQQFKLGGVYKCGNGYVRIIADLSDDDKHPSCFHQLVGVSCDRHGNSLNCATGMFSSNATQFGHYMNPNQLNHTLEYIIEEAPVKKPYTLELTEEQVNKIKQDIKDGVL